MSTSNQTPVSPERILQMAWGYAPPLAIESAIRLGVFDRLDGQPESAEQIATDSRCSLRGITALLNLQVGLGLLKKTADGSYTLTPESRTFLVSSKPSFQGGMFRHISSQLMPKWLELTQVVQTGKPASTVNDQSDGSEFFIKFVEDIFPMSYPSARVLAEHLDTDNARTPISVLDLAAGSGVWGIALAQKSPHVSVRAVDWPRVLDVTRRVVQRFGLSDRYTFAAGDLTDADFGAGHQIATLGHILHSEGATRSRALLQKTFRALAPGGTIAIAEFLVNEDRTAPVGSLIFAMNMLVNTTDGNTYSFEEVKSWLEDAGFEQARLLPAPGPSPLILANRPQ
jgi:ubiquinone/menaquinone biosynthesis C-methylase UbiE